MPKRTRHSVLSAALIVFAACGSSKPTSQPPTITAEVQPSPPPTIVTEIRPFLTVRDLRASSDSVLLGTFGSKTASQRNNGGNEADTQGIPTSFYEFQVSRVLSGRDLGPKVEVVTIENLSPSDVAGLRPQPGQVVVIFAQILSATTAPGLKLSGPTINAASGNNGVFDVANGRARARLNIVSIDGPAPAPSSLPPAGLSPLLDISLTELEVAANRAP
jgi:hypothetical protein